MNIGNNDRFVCLIFFNILVPKILVIIIIIVTVAMFENTQSYIIIIF